MWKKRAFFLYVAIAICILVAGGVLFPPGLQTGRNTIYCIVSTPYFTLFVSRPDKSRVPRLGFSLENPFPFVENGLTFERLHSYKPPDS